MWACCVENVNMYVLVRAKFETKHKYGVYVIIVRKTEFFLLLQKYKGLSKSTRTIFVL
jgi:hypothetical protein